MKYLLLLLASISVLVAGCGEAKPEKKTPPGQTLKQDPITDLGIDGAKSRIVAAAEIILKYVEKHGAYPEGADSFKLRDTLRPEFGHVSGFEELWVSHNGKTLIHYNQGVAGKKREEIRDPDRTWLLKDPVAIKPFGYAIAYCSGRVDAVVEQPAIGAATPM
jgi:hypothetical protein